MSGRMDQPSFTIVIPTYQRRDSVCAVVAALSRQTYKGEFVVVVVVDGSTDGTADALAKVSCPFPLRIVEQPNRGAASARNRGAANASGEILLFLDDDMIAEPDLLEQHARMYRAGADAVTGDMPLHADSPKGFLWKDLAMSVDWDRDAPATAFDIFTGQLSVRRSAFEHLGGFDESFTTGGGYGNEDLDFGVKLVEAFKVRHNADAVTRQLSRVQPRQFMRRARLLAQADLRFAEKHPQLASQLFDNRGASQRMVRVLYRPISRIPFFSTVLAEVAVRTCELGLRTPFRWSRNLKRLFSIAYTASYWSVVDPGLRLLHPKQPN
jgi:glycosyltransferase involved in cell wall biosynthesis